jgi:hypothetical protein
MPEPSLWNLVRITWHLSPSHRVLKSVPPVSWYVYPPVVAMQRLGRNVTASKNTKTTVKELLNASFSMGFVSYQVLTMFVNSCGEMKTKDIRWENRTFGGMIIDNGKPEYSEEGKPQWRFVYQKSHTHCSEIESESPLSYLCDYAPLNVTARCY